MTIEHEFPKGTPVFSSKWKQKTRSLLESRLNWFADLPGSKWADRYGDKWTLMHNLMNLTLKLKKARRLIVRIFSIYIILVILGAITTITTSVLFGLNRTSYILTLIMIIGALAINAANITVLIGLITYIVNHVRLVRLYNHCFQPDDTEASAS